MVLSMTGYGEGMAKNERGTLKVTIKSVNHRYFEPVFRLPFVFARLENDLRKRLSGQMRRGRLDVRLFFESVTSGEGRFRVDTVAAKAALDALRELEQLTGQDIENKPALIADMDGIFAGGLPESADDDLKTLAMTGLDHAVSALNDMRRAEGEALAANVKAICDQVACHVNQVQAIAKGLPARQQTRLSDRIQVLLGEQTDEYYPGQRLAAEVALLVDKMAIDEEIVRLKSHIEQMVTTLTKNEAIGKRLDFLAQEMNREVNTIGSKANDVDLTDLVVEMKNDVEKIREQVQNIE